jgi:hypothetical protein
LFCELNDHLVSLLRALADQDWHRPTISSERDVKDIASHLLDGSLRRLSSRRDRYKPPDSPKGFDSHQELVDYLARVNAEWTRATRRISPRILVQLIEQFGRELAELFESLDPFALAPISVLWAGESESQNWFDVAREYTERWHHAQQIFEAVGRRSTITARRLFHPCLDTFMRALPFTYRDVEAEDGTVVAVIVRGPAGGVWFLRRHAGCWAQVQDDTARAAATVTLGQDSAWKLFTKRMSRDAARARFPDIEVNGDVALGGHVLDMVAVMA